MEHLAARPADERDIKKTLCELRGDCKFANYNSVIGE